MTKNFKVMDTSHMSFKRGSLFAQEVQDANLELGFLSQHGLRKLPSLATTGLDFCSFLSCVINSQSLTAGRDELSASDDTPDKNINLPQRTPEPSSIHPSKGQHPDSNPQACTQSKA